MDEMTARRLGMETAHRLRSGWVGTAWSTVGMLHGHTVLQQEQAYVRNLLPQARVVAQRIMVPHLRAMALATLDILRAVERDPSDQATKDLALDAGEAMMEHADRIAHTPHGTAIAWIADALLNVGNLADQGVADVQTARVTLLKLSDDADDLVKSITSQTKNDKWLKDRVRELSSKLKRLAGKPRKRELQDEVLVASQDVLDALKAGINLKHRTSAQTLVDQIASTARMVTAPVVADEAELKQLAELIWGKTPPSPVKRFVQPLLIAVRRAARYPDDPHAAEALGQTAAQLAGVADTVANTGDGLLAATIAAEAIAPPAMAAGQDQERKRVQAGYAQVLPALSQWASKTALPKLPVRGLILIRTLILDPSNQDARDKAQAVADALRNLGDPDATKTAQAIETSIQR